MPVVHACKLHCKHQRKESWCRRYAVRAPRGMPAGVIPSYLVCLAAHMPLLTLPIGCTISERGAGPMPAWGFMGKCTLPSQARMHTAHTKMCTWDTQRLMSVCYPDAPQIATARQPVDTAAYQEPLSCCRQMQATHLTLSIRCPSFATTHLKTTCTKRSFAELVSKRWKTPVMVSGSLLAGAVLKVLISPRVWACTALFLLPKWYAARPPRPAQSAPL